MKRPVVRWVAPAGPTTGLAELCARLGGAALGALEGGRLFVDGVRATEDRGVDAGSVIEVYAPRHPADAVTVLDERAGLVFVSKPSGVPTEPDRAGTSESVVARVATTLGVPMTELHALSRLDGGTDDSSSMLSKNRVSFWRFLGNSLVVCVLGVLGTVLSNAIIAYGFARIRWRGRGLSVPRR